MEIGQDFSDYDVKFIMVEMKLRNTNLLYEPETIKTYWQKWLASMGITKSKFVYSGENASDAIEELFLQGERVTQLEDDGFPSLVICQTKND